ncbi:hypothetical protein EB796_019652 [Bugula neritina]|uniref:Uncharacterized protein n=1 Tax=Bugula neritina TaxID=10212 RepID=A0A7J7J732_BUGNE|nr:hypothetical protein EB796_019652 [Bugula neritina]
MIRLLLHCRTVLWTDSDSERLQTLMADADSDRLSFCTKYFNLQFYKVPQHIFVVVIKQKESSCNCSQNG